MDRIPTDEERGLSSPAIAPLFLEVLVLPSTNHLRSFTAPDPPTYDAEERVTVREAGRRGGNVVAEKYGRDFYVAIGKKGGAVTSKRLGHDHYEAIGKKGGATMKRKAAAGEGLSKEHYQSIGRKGGAIVREVFAELRRRNAEESPE